MPVCAIYLYYSDEYSRAVLSPMDITGLGSVFDFGSKILDKIFPDPAAKAQAQLELLKQTQAGEFKEMDAALAEAQAQSAVNQVEAASPDTFVAGWRPFIGWVCGSAFAINFVIGPMGEWLALLAGKTAHFPTLDVATMMPVLMGMLGLGGMRTYEKFKGVA